VIKRCSKITKDEGIDQCQNYKNTMKKLLLKQSCQHAKRKKEAADALHDSPEFDR